MTPDTAERLGLRKASVIMVDCDLYSSTVPCLRLAGPLIRDEAVILFDDWHTGGLARRSLGERRRFEEFLAATPGLEVVGKLEPYSDASAGRPCTAAAGVKPARTVRTLVTPRDTHARKLGVGWNRWVVWGSARGDWAEAGAAAAECVDGRGARTATYTEPVQEVLDVSNEVAAELATVDDEILRALRDRLGCAVLLRGNRLTLEGEEGKVGEARAVIDELVELVEGGHAIGAGTVDAVLAALDESRDLRDVFEDVVWRHRGKKITPKTVNQKLYVDAIRGHTVTFGIGPAGTGKTYLAIALAVAAMAERQVNRLILTRPAVEAGERLGFLPGDLMAKVDPYLRPLFDALYDMLDADRVTSYMEKGQIEVAPLAFMRGRTLNDSFIILDEAQNTTPEQMQMFLTRLGFGSKVVVTGDVTQIDLPREQASGLIRVREVLKHVDGIEFVELGNQDVVRHVLVQRIVEAYKSHAEGHGDGTRR
jgi:phosphate starvation-inducible protein PhoH and related proteins